jgi:lipopolysaccharide export system protein LptA
MESKGPVVITSSTLTADNKAHTALFEGSVVAKTESMTLYSDRMLVYSSEEGKVTKMEASGHVKLIKGEKIITSDEAVYFADEDKAVFTGQPKAVEGGTMVTGTRMTYLLSEDRSVVENSRVFLEKGVSKGR